MATAIPGVGRHVRPRTWGWLTWPLSRHHALATLRAQLHLSPDERIQVTVMSGEGDSVVGTAQAVYWRSPGAGWLRLGWHEIARIEQDPNHHKLVLTSLSHGLTRRCTLRVRTNRRLIDFAQERIAASRILVTRITIDGRQLWMEARREPATGNLHWFVRPIHRVDPDDSPLPAISERVVAELRSTLGLEDYL